MNAIIIASSGAGAGGGGGSNNSVGPTGVTAPGYATELGIIVAGNLVGVSASNPIPISGSISATNPSVAPTGAAVPADATYIGVEDGSGNLQGASSSNPVRIDPTGTTIQPIEIGDGTNFMGAMTNFGTTPTAVKALVTNASIFAGTTALSATGSSLNVNVTGGASNTQYTDGTAESASAFTITVAGLYNGTGVVGLRGDASNNLLTKINVALPAGTNVIGHIIVDSGTITTVSTVTAVTAITNALPAGTNVIGHVITDSGSVTNATLSAETTKVIGTVNQGTSPWVVSLTSTTVTGVVEVAPTGSANTLSNQFFVQLSDGTHGQTFMSTTTSSKYGADTNILAILGTAPTTAGFLDIKGADGNIFVRQATAANLNATVVGTGTFAVQATLSAGSAVIGHVIVDSGTITTVSTVTAVTTVSTVTAVTAITNALPAGTNVIGHVITDSGSVTTATLNAETTKVIGTVRVLGNVGAAFDAATNAAPPANAVQVGMVAATALPSAYTATDLTPPMVDKFGRQVVLQGTIRDLTGSGGTTITSTTAATSIIASGGANVFTDITSLDITNSSATALIVTLSDGTASYIWALAANGGIAKTFSPPLPATSTATAWTLTCGTSVASIYVVAAWAKNK